MIRGSVTFVASQSILRVDGVPFFHASVPMCFGQDGRGRNRNAAGVASDERLLFNQNIQLHGVDEQIIGRDGELLQGSSHGLSAGLIDVPSIDPLGVDFRHSPSESMVANTRGKFGAALRGNFFRIIEADNATLGIENDRGGDDGAKERAATGFIETGDAHPAKLSRRSLETGRAEAAHCAQILARGARGGVLLVSQGNHGIDFGGPPRWEVGREQGNQQEDEHDGDERQWVSGSHAVKQLGHEPREQKSSSNAAR